MNIRIAVVLLTLFSCGGLVAADTSSASVNVSASVNDDGLGLPFKVLKPSTPREMAMLFFEEALAPYGKWEEVPSLGACWKPKVDARWAPYTEGRWGFSEAGWTWLSDEDFGSIVFHYGRWFRTAADGWRWVPGVDWAGAWVAWRYGTEHLGWAPLPPSANWQPQVGIAAWADREYSIGPNLYRFCLIGDLTSPTLKEQLLPVSENQDRVRRTVNTTNIAPFRGGIFCGGPAFDWISARSKGSIRMLDLVKERGLARYQNQMKAVGESPTKFRGLLNGNQLYLLVPDWTILADTRKADALGYKTREGIEEAKKQGEWKEGDGDLKAEEAALIAAAASKKRAVAKPMILTGWEGISDDGSRNSLQAKVAREVSGLNPDNTPAKPVDPENDLPKRAVSALR